MPADQWLPTNPIYISLLYMLFTTELRMIPRSPEKCALAFCTPMSCKGFPAAWRRRHETMPMAKNRYSASNVTCANIQRWLDICQVVSRSMKKAETHLEQRAISRSKRNQDRLVCKLEPTTVLLCSQLRNCVTHLQAMVDSLIEQLLQLAQQITSAA